MKRSLKKLTALIIAVLFMLSFMVTASAMPALSLATYISSQPGLTATAVGNTVTVTADSGTAIASAPLTLNIDSGVTVNWNAGFSGSLDRARYILTLSGGGTFNLTNSGSIANDAGGAINITGAGTIVSINGVLNSSGSGVTLNIAANNVTVNNSGTVRNDGSNSAIQVAVGCTGVKINVTDGEVISTPGGYAINDGGTALCENNTQIMVAGNAVITAESGCAIRSTGKSSAVFVLGGAITNAASNNANPTIYMNGGTGNNVTVSGASRVESTSPNGYTIQTTGNVLVQDSAQVIAVNGRAINLVGPDSIATIKGGEVKATGSGVAISTATTAGVNVENSAVVVTGGLVSSAGGYAIQVTGINSKVQVSGGWVSTTTTHAIYVAGTGTAAEVTISGGWVSATSTTGRAIYLVGNAQNAAVTVNNGFVFSYGAQMSDVVNKPGFSTYADPGVIVAWNADAGKREYDEGDNQHLFVRPVPLSDPNGKVVWHNGGTANGVYYANGANTGFFPLPVDIKIDSSNVGLIYDVYTDAFYLYSGTGGYTDIEYTDQPSAWNVLTPGVLELTGFIWVTGYPVALEIINSIGGSADLIIDLTGTNSFITTNTATTATGILSADDITIDSSGALTAVAVGGCGIDANAFTIRGGDTVTTLTASGGDSAFARAPAPPDGYIYWTSEYADGSGAAQSVKTPTTGTAYGYSAGDEYVKIQTLVPHDLTVIDGTGISITSPYYAGEIVTLTANIPASIRTAAFPGTFPSVTGPVYPPNNGPEYAFPDSIVVFKAWTSDAGGSFLDANASTASFTMPDNEATVMVETQPAYKLLLSGAHFSGTVNLYLGYYIEGEEVLLQTNASSNRDGWFFKGWEESPLAPNGLTPVPGGGTFSNTNSFATIYTMPGANAYILAPFVQDTSYAARPFIYSLTVINGTGSVNDIRAGTWVNLVAEDRSSEELEFSHWEVSVDEEPPAYQGAFINVNNPTTEFIMAEGNVTVTAIYTEPRYMLIVVNGTDDTDEPSYIAGAQVQITADPDPEDQEFDRWISSGYDDALEDATAGATTFTMPADTVIVTATYKDVQNTGGDNPGEGGENPGEGGENPGEGGENPGEGGENPGEGGENPGEGGENPGEGGENPGEGGDNPKKSSDDSRENNDAPEEGGDVSDLLDTENHIAYIQGIGGNLFAPDKNTTRAEVAQMLYNLLLEKDVEITKSFPDVPEKSWYARAVNTIASLGIILGYPDGGFHPGDSITRAEFTAIVVRFTKETSDASQVSHFIDVPAEHWAYDCINTATDYGWITGYGDGRFQPDRPISRAEAVTLMNRVLERYPDKNHIDEHTELPRFSDVTETHWAFYDIMEAYIPHDYMKHDSSEEWVA